MKDYYDILGVPKSADSSEIKIAFRRLAFEHHPDKNPGNEKQAEERFKEINEAYSVLSDEAKRQEYNALRSGRFAGVGSNRGFRSYNQEDIFRETFADQAAFDDLKRMFSQAGLRFDENFLNRVFFSGRGFQIRFVKGQGGGRWSYQKSEAPPAGRKPNFIERFLLRLNHKLAKFLLKKVFGIHPDRPSNDNSTKT